MSHGMDDLAGLTSALAERYEIEREIGKGGMATVYVARDVRHNRRVALKVLNPELSAVIGSDRFLKEIDVTANLQHPHILPLFDSGNAAGQLFYVMPFVDGETLRARLQREQQLPVADAVRIASEVADALAYAHKRNVIHRDIKPENILLQDGHALVADFGIALAVQQAGAGRLTQTGLSLGTPQYMSPEQAMGERTIDARTDVYALGAVTYEMLAGEPPFTGPTAQAVIAKVITSEPLSPRQLRKSVTEQIEWAVLHALEKVPSDRFASAAEFSSALNGSLAGPATTAVVAGSQRGKRYAGSLRGVALAAAAMAAGVLATWFVMHAAAPSQTAARPRQFSIVLADSLPFVVATDPFGTGLKSLDLAPDGRTLVYTSATPTGRRLVAVSLDDDIATIVRGADGARSPAFSPDGKSVAAVLGDSEVRRFSLVDGSTSRIAVRPTQTIVWGTPRIYFDGGCASASVTGGDLARDNGRACASDWVISEAAPIAARTDSMLAHVQGWIEIVSASTGGIRHVTIPASGAREESRLYGSAPHFVAPGYLIFMQGSTLFAAPFDSRTLRLTGQPRALFSNIRREQSGLAQLSISNEGTLAWVEGGDGALSRFVWVSETGRVMDTVSFTPATEVGSYALSGDGRRIAYSAVGPDRVSRLMIADLDRRVVDAVPFPERLDPMNWTRKDEVLSAILVHANGTTRGASVSMATGRAAVDTTGGLLATESHDGSMRCLELTSFTAVDVPQPVLLIHTGSAPDTVMLDRSGSNCRFSPDGRFASWNGLRGNVFAAATERGRSKGRISVAQGGGEAQWSADSRTIYYRGQDAWYSVAAPDAKLADTPHLLFRGNFLQALASWDRAPDGRFLLLAGEPAERVNRLRVITNFGNYLAERMAKNP
jgi:eukaryotic-like serine/threonine-protein kinase